MVMSANGVVAQKKIENSFEWTSTEDRQQFMKRISDIGTVFMGGNTFRSIGQKPYPGVDFFVLTRKSEQFRDFPNVTYVKGAVKDLYRMIQSRGIKQLALLGGPETNAQFFEQGLVDEIYLTIEPLMMPQGMQLFNTLEHSIGLTLNEVKKLNQSTLLLHYLVQHNN